MPDGNETQLNLDISQFMPEPILKLVASFLGLKDLTNFSLVSKKFKKISTEVINELKKHDPKSIHEINEIMLDKFPFFKEVFTYRQNITKALIEGHWNIDKVNSEVTPLIQTNIKTRGMRLSKNGTIALCLFAIAFILAGAMWAGIDIRNKKDNSHAFLQALLITAGAVCFIGAGCGIKSFYPSSKVRAFAEHIQKPTSQVIVSKEKQKSEPKIQAFFQKRAEFFNALAPEVKGEIISEEVLEQSKYVLKSISEIYSWLFKEQKLSPEMAEMMSFYCQKLNEFTADDTVTYDELPKFIQEIMEAHKTVSVNDEVIVPMDKQTEQTSSFS